MILNTFISGDSHGLPPVLLVHGLYGAAKNLGGLARRMDGTRKVISVDMRNHGASFHADDHSYTALAGDLSAVINMHGGIADVVGHSMGGKAAMTLALSQPDLVRRLIVMDIAPFAYTHSQQHYIDAMEGLELSDLHLRSEADRRLAVTIDDPGVRAFLLQNLDLKTQPPRWRLNLSALSNQMPQIIGWPDDLPRETFAGPALFLAGGKSDYVISDSQTEAAINAYFPQAKLRHFPDCGHWLHAEQPKLVADTVAEFLG